MTPEDIKLAYWGRDMSGPKISWQVSNVQIYFSERGVSMDVVNHVHGTDIVFSDCGRCKKPNLPFKVDNRVHAQQVWENLCNGRGWCEPCWEIHQMEENAKIFAQQKLETAQKLEAIETKRKAIETKRKALILRHGTLMTGELCPGCKEGYLIVRLNSTQMKPFLGCSDYNPFRYGCKYAQPLAEEMYEKFMPVFRARLAKKEKVESNN